MDKSKIAGFIDDPSHLDASTLPEVNELVKQFPYCQTLRILQLFNLKNINHINYESHLKMAAIYSADRRRLYNLMHEIKPAFEDVETESQTSEEEIPIEITENASTELHEDKGKQIVYNSPKTDQKLTAAEIIENRLREISGKESRVQKPEDTSPGVRESSRADPDYAGEEFPEDEELAVSEQEDQEIITEESGEAVNTFETVELNIPDEEKPQKDSGSVTVEKDEKATQVESEEVVASEPEIEETGLYEENDVTAQPPISEVPDDNGPVIEHASGFLSTQAVSPEIKDQKHSFNGWLRLLNKKENTSSVQGSETDQGQEPPLETKPKTHRQKEIIEKFIKEDPKIEAGKAAFFSPVNMARNSAIEHEDIYSETLAGILFQQELYEKSRQMYQKLLLNFPEKSSYFAARIKEIDEIINANK